MIKIRDFLAVTRPADGEILVVESWYKASPTMADAVAAIRRGNYRKVVCVALTDFEDIAAGEPAGAEQAARYLIGMGIDPGMLQVLNVPPVDRNRTYTSAVAVRNWQQHALPNIRSIDVFTKSIHARKSQLLYRKAFPPQMKVGIIAGMEEPYRYRYWWLSRRGIYVIARNTVGYLYALAFSPPASAAAP